MIALIASRSRGIVTRIELLAAGIGREAIQIRLGRGSLIREHRGVYRVGHRAPRLETTYLAAVRAGGDGALLCGPAAAHLLRLLKGPPPAPEVITRTERRIPGVRTHRARAYDQRDATLWRAIPTTTVARTLVDLATTLNDDEPRACHEASVLHRTTPGDVEAVLARRPSAPGARSLRRVIHGDERVTLSELERAFLRLLEGHDLPLPQTNQLVGARRVDCRWPERRLTIELDSYRYHGSRHAWEQDRRRERDARARGDEFRRYTYGDVLEHPGLMLAELRALLKPAAPAA